MSGDNLSPSPSPQASSPIVFHNDEKPSLSMLDTAKRDDKFGKRDSRRPSTRFEIAF